MRSLHQQLVTAGFGLWACLAAAADVAPSTTGLPVASPERFGRFEDSFAVWNHMRNNGWTGKDEGALRAHYSFGYTFCGPRLGSGGAPVVGKGERYVPLLSPCRLLSWLGPDDAEFLVAYTGEFDFYVGTRASGPVINRLSNPGLFLRMPLASLGLKNSGLAHRDSVTLGLEHRSDGQVTDATTAENARRAQIEYAAGNHAYFDTISVGANYWSITLDRTDTWGTGVDMRVKTRWYLKNQESAVTWGPRAYTGSRFSDYDRLQLNLSRRLGPLVLDAEWRVGGRGLAADSWTFGATWVHWEIPFYLRLHHGPMNTLSNYTQRQDSIGIGLRFVNL